MSRIALKTHWDSFSTNLPSGSAKKPKVAIASFIAPPQPRSQEILRHYLQPTFGDRIYWNLLGGPRSVELLVVGRPSSVAGKLRRGFLQETQSHLLVSIPLTRALHRFLFISNPTDWHLLSLPDPSSRSLSLTQSLCKQRGLPSISHLSHPSTVPPRAFLLKDAGAEPTLLHTASTHFAHDTVQSGTVTPNISQFCLGHLPAPRTSHTAPSDPRQW